MNKYQPSSGQSSSLLMKASFLRLKLVELNFFVSFTTDDQSTFNVSGVACWENPRSKAPPQGLLVQTPILAMSGSKYGSVLLAGLSEKKKKYGQSS